MIVEGMYTRQLNGHKDSDKLIAQKKNVLIFMSIQLGSKKNLISIILGIFKLGVSQWLQFNSYLASVE